MSNPRTHLGPAEQAELELLTAENARRLDALTDAGVEVDFRQGFTFVAMHHLCEWAGILDRVTLEHERNVAVLLGDVEAAVADARETHEAEQRPKLVTAGGLGPLGLA